MPTVDEARQGLVLLTQAAISTVAELVTTSPDRTRDALLLATPEVVAYYSEGSAALAADHYDDLREGATVATAYRAEPVVNLREEKIRRGVLWAVEPLFGVDPDTVLTTERIAQVVQLESARPFRETITTNTKRDPSSVGWRRVAGDGCKFCRLLAGRGAIYRADTARFASHPHCDCTAAPVFDGEDGEEASAIQYVASLRKRTPAQQQALRDYLAAMPD